MNKPAIHNLPHTGAEEDCYTYSGPAHLQADVRKALEQVFDPEVALNIVDIGLIYDVTVDDERTRIIMTMTSAACPVTGVIIEDIQMALKPVLPHGMPVDVELVWEPAWSTERLSHRARLLMGW